MKDVLGSLGVGLLFVAGSLAQRWGVLGSLWPVRENGALHFSPVGPVKYHNIFYMDLIC